MAPVAVRALIAFLPRDAAANALHSAVDSRLLLFTFLVSVAAGVLSGFAPALHGTRVDLNRVLRESARGTTASGLVSRLRGALVVAEFALALVLLVGAALLVQSFWRLQQVDLGFRPASVLTARLWLPQPNEPSTGPYFTHPARVAFRQ
jgi:hypothetical protein